MGSTSSSREIDITTLSDIWILDLPTGDAEPYLNSASYEWEPQVSPNGRWLAYVSDESNQHVVYVQSFPKSGDKRRISVDGARRPRWRADGEELYYVGSDGMFVAATLVEQPSGCR